MPDGSAAVPAVAPVGLEPTRVGGHPHIPNTAPESRARMLEALGLASAAELYAGIPEHLRLDRPLDVPGPLRSEQALTRHVRDLLGRDRGCDDLLSFLGGGCWQHHVPALCEEIVGRAELLTAFWADGYSDHGKYQAFFEYASLMGELLEMDAVSLPTYDWGMAAGVALRMACRITGRPRALVPATLGPDRGPIVDTYLAPDVGVATLPTDPTTGTVDLAGLERALDASVGAVYIESPTYLGAIECAGAEIAERCHAHGALLVVGVDPISLGVLAPPASYGADLACGELQPLGIPMHHGAGLAGFIASADDERFVSEYPTFLIGLAPTAVEDNHGFGLVAWDRTSYVRRQDGKDFGGTTTGLWAVAAAVYLSLLGPVGLRELGAGIVQRRRYAAQRLGEVPGITLPGEDAPRFKEFPLSFASAGRSVGDVNRRLLELGILGGHDLSPAFPALRGSGLYCVTEIHTRADIERLAEGLEEVLDG